MVQTLMAARLVHSILKNFKDTVDSRQVEPSRERELNLRFEL